MQKYTDFLQEFHYNGGSIYQANNEEFIKQTPSYYFEISTHRGILISIGSKSLDGKAQIFLNTADFPIYISNEQEKILINHFKKAALELTVRKKLNLETEKINSAELIDFEIIENKLLADSIKEIEEKYPNGLFPDIEDSVEYIRKLRQGYET